MAEVLSFPVVQGSIRMKLFNFLNLLTSFNQKSHSHSDSQTILLQYCYLGIVKKIHKELLRINIMMSTYRVLSCSLKDHPSSGHTILCLTQIIVLLTK